MEKNKKIETCCTEFVSLNTSSAVGGFADGDAVTLVGGCSTMRAPLRACGEGIISNRCWR